MKKDKKEKNAALSGHKILRERVKGEEKPGARRLTGGDLRGSRTK